MAFNAYMQIPAATGTTDIDIQSFSWGSSNATVNSVNREANPPSVSQVVITKKIDISSPALFRACAAGQHFPTATLNIVTGGTGLQEAFTYTMTNVAVSSAEYAGNAGGGDTPVESVTFKFTKWELSTGK